MSLPVVIFTFECDHACAVFAAKSAIAAGLGPVFVEVDGKKPIPPATAQELRRMGCEVREVFFDRHMNMRSLATMLGMMASYDYVFARTGSKHLVKLDSDTYIGRAHRLLQAAADDVASAAGCATTYPFYGWCCVISRRLNAALKDFVAKWGGFPGWDNQRFPEDKVVGFMSERLNVGETRLWEFNPTGSFGAGYRYVAAMDPLQVYASKYDVVTFGNRHLIPGPGSPCAKRDKVAATMLEFHKLFTPHHNG